MTTETGVGSARRSVWVRRVTAAGIAAAVAGTDLAVKAVAERQSTGGGSGWVRCGCT